jgi:NAD(P)-dependent dehydrogenase (short-subunit alcohol dehydrogenase family)
MRFTSKVVLITGGGSGIGRATALAFAAEGATVAVAGRRFENIDQTARLIEADGGRASAIVADVASTADAARLVATTVQRHGGLDIAFNNAGTIEAGPLADMDEAAWDRLLAVNLTGVFLTMKHEITHMRANGGGVIVNTASNLGAHMRLPFLSGYVATKAAVSALTRAATRSVPVRLTRPCHCVPAKPRPTGRYGLRMPCRRGEREPSAKQPPRCSGSRRQKPASPSATT